MIRFLCSILTVTFTFFLLIGTAEASQPTKFQLSAIASTVVNWDGSRASGLLAGGAAVIPLKSVDGKLTFLRLVGAGGVMSPHGTPIAVPTARGLAFVGFTPVTRVNFLVGSGLVALWVPSNFQLTPVGAFSVNFWIKPGRFSVNLPTVISAKGLAFNCELILTF